MPKSKQGGDDQKEGGSISFDDVLFEGEGDQEKPEEDGDPQAAAPAGQEGDENPPADDEAA